MQDRLIRRHPPHPSTDRRSHTSHRAAPRALVLGTLTLLGTAGCQSGSLPSEPEPAGPARANGVALAEAAPNSWRAGPSMPTGRYGLVAATVNGIVYAIGGWFNGQLRTVEAFNPGTKTLVPWKPKAPLPAVRSWPSGVAVINGKIYLPGGKDGNDAPTKSLFVYNTATDHWATKAAMPVPSAGGAAGTINGKLFVYTPARNGTVPYLHRYDPGTNTWTKRATPLHGNEFPAAGVIDGKLYLAGGFITPASPSNALDVYNPATNTWTTRKSMPAPRGYAAGRVLNGKLYVLGGSSGGGNPLSRVERYDPVSNTWIARSDMPTARLHLAAATANGVLYALGGLGASNAYWTNETYTP
jgi:N-acetylneuraminic acid mutarotase